MLSSGNGIGPRTGVVLAPPGQGAARQGDSEAGEDINVDGAGMSVADGEDLALALAEQAGQEGLGGVVHVDEVARGPSRPIAPAAPKVALPAIARTEATTEPDITKMQGASAAAKAADPAIPASEDFFNSIQTAVAGLMEFRRLENQNQGKFTDGKHSSALLTALGKEMPGSEWARLQRRIEANSNIQREMLDAVTTFPEGAIFSSFKEALNIIRTLDGLCRVCRKLGYTHEADEGERRLREILRINNVLYAFDALSPDPEWLSQIRALIPGAALREHALPFLAESSFSDPDTGERFNLDGWNAILKYRGTQTLTGALAGAIPSIGELVLPSVPQDSTVHPLRFFGKGWQFYEHLGCPKTTARLYVTLNPDQYVGRAPEMVQELINRMEMGSAAGKFTFKIDPEHAAMLRRDHIVVYFNHADEVVVTEAVLQAKSAVDARHGPPVFSPKGPYFTAHIADGIFFGQHPENGLEKTESFGSLRARAMQRAWNKIKFLEESGTPVDDNLRAQIVAYYFQQSGIDINEPAFNAGGQRLFPYIVHLLSDADTVVNMDRIKF